MRISRRILLQDLTVAGMYLATIVYLILKVSFLDIKDHNQLLREYLAAGSFPIPPGYYFLIYLLDMVVRVKYSFVASSALVLTFFLWWKYKLVFKSIKQNIAGLKSGIAFLLAVSFLFLSPIYVPAIDGPLWYLGKFTQTIWHNSTLICVFPFCLLLVWKTFDWFQSGEWRYMGLMFLFSLIIILIKPSFLFCYIPALPIYLLIRDQQLSRAWLQSVGFVSLLFTILMIEKYLIFTWDPVLDTLYTPEERSHVVINPLTVWLRFSNEPIFDFVTSLPLVISYLALWRKEAFKSPFFNFSLLLLSFALLVYLLLAETGFREFHGNFYWQVPIALFLCHLSIVFSVMTQFLEEGKKIKTRYILIFSIYLIQVMLGLGYWIRMFTGATLS
jgi:hypothetical protein